MEYLLTTVTLVVIFTAMYGYLHAGLKVAFEKGGVIILRTYN